MNVMQVKEMGQQREACYCVSHSANSLTRLADMPTSDSLTLSLGSVSEDAFNLIYWRFVFGGALALACADNPASKLEIGRSPHAACEWADLSIDS